MHKWTLIKAFFEPYESQMFKEAVLEARNQEIIGDTLFLLRQPPYVSLGHNIPLNHIDRESCVEREIPVIRASFPGGPLLFAKTLSAAMVAKVQALKEVTGYFHESILEALEELGLDAKLRSPKSNDIFVNNKKAAGSSVLFRGDAFLLSSIINLGFDQELAERVLRPPATKMGGRENIRDYVTSIEQELGREVPFEELEDTLEQVLAKRVDFEDAEISSELQAMTESLRGKYTSEEWIKYGKWSPVKDYWRPE